MSQAVAKDLTWAERKIPVGNKRRPWEKHIPPVQVESFSWGPLYCRPLPIDMHAMRVAGAPMTVDPVVDAAVGRGHAMLVTQSGS
jgi:hypothetical protein